MKYWNKLIVDLDAFPNSGQLKWKQQKFLCYILLYLININKYIK